MKAIVGESGDSNKYNHKTRERILQLLSPVVQREENS